MNKPLIFDHKLKQALKDAYLDASCELPCAITDEMAVPAYLETSAIPKAVFWRKLDLVLKSADLGARMRVLDFGCGTGVLLPRLCEEDRYVYATDLQLQIAQNMVTRLKLENVSLLDSDRWHETIPNAHLDRIIAANVLEHVEQRQPTLHLLMTKLKPSGRMVICGPTENTLYKLGRRILSRRLKSFSGDYHVANVADVLEDATKVGLRRIATISFPTRGPGCLYQIATFARR